jgi:Zinc carboxypeptidase
MQTEDAITWQGTRCPQGRVLLAASIGLVLIVSLISTGTSHAQEQAQVAALTVEQQQGFATLSWNPVVGATEYQIERTPVDDDNNPTGEPVIAGIWRPNRQVDQDSPAFADANFNPGDRFRWRVAVTGEPFSNPVYDTTLPLWGDPGVPGQNLRTQWEMTQAAQFTSDVNEYAYTSALDAASDRVRVVEIGRTVLDRPINMFIIGYPTPPATAKKIAKSSSALVNCNVHGNEPSSREACLILARQLAFGDDARTIDILSNTTVLIVPAINGDGRAANTRGNSTGQDLNRDFSLIREPETFAFVKMLRDYRPEAGFDGHEFGNDLAGDLPVLYPRHLNVAGPVFSQAKDLIEGWLYEQGSVDGWWYCPYGCEGGGAVGLSQETILRNTMGLKNVVGALLEARSAGGATRPSDGGANTPNSRKRKTYSALNNYHEFLDYYLANQSEIIEATEDGAELQSLNLGRIVFRGSYDVPAFPPPHPGESPPPPEIPTPDQILEDPPCGYLLTEEQYNGPRTDGPEGLTTTLAQRIDAHGWRVQTRPAGYMVPLTQPERGLIPLLLDGQAAEPWVAAQRLYPPPAVSQAPLPDSACGLGRGPASPNWTPSAEDLNYIPD